ncbi:MAG: Gfo/Idh/MocA family oxidoreductase [Planctomycetes bacterium]|nr:Gfo/Idh/MocA family oxidoreductase [Planctomycetota bacterium]
MPLTLNRREALKGAVSAASFGPISASLATENDANLSADKLNIGVIGVGNRGASNIAEIKSQNIVALCDVDRQYLDAMALRYPDARICSEFRELLEQPGLDAVLISTPDHTHFHAAMTAMRRGLHVYCEKPLAHSIWETREMAAAAKRFRVVTQTGNQHHASDGYRRAVEIIRSDVLGEVKEVHAWTNRPIWPQGVERPKHSPPIPEHLDWDAWLGPAPARPYHDTYHPRGWRGWHDFGCGAIGDMGPHLLDPVVWAFNLGAPTTIAAESSEVNDETFPTWSIVYLDFLVGEVKKPLKLIWYDGDKQPPEGLTGIERLPPHGVLFMGKRAKLFAPQYGGPPIVIPNEKGDSIELPEPFLPPSPGHHQEWLAACKQGGTASCDFSYGARLTEICLLGNIAIRTGKTLKWDDQQMRTSNGVDVERLLRREYREGWNVQV